MNINLNPNQTGEVFTKVSEVIDSISARKGLGYSRVLSSIYSLAALCQLHPLFIPIGEQLMDGIGELLKDSKLAEELTADFNMLIRINMNAVIKEETKAKRNEPPPT